MTYSPRLTAPSSSNKWFIHTSYGGKNSCIHISGGSVLPNCVGYAWGRFGEIMNKQPELSTGDAYTFYGKTSDGYKRGTEPKLGAVACWSKPGGAGHVAIVEKIHSNGDITISESGWGASSKFWTSRQSPPNYYYDSYNFQGFIYNPAVVTESLLEQFVNIAYSHVGEGNKWVCDKTGIQKSKHWSAAFVWACAKEIKVTGDIIYGTSSASSMIKNSKEKGATFYRGPYFNFLTTPKVGDIVAFRDRQYENSEYWKADRLAIVKKVNKGDKGNIQVVEGDVDGKVKLKTYKLASTSISGYLRLNWKVVEDLTANDTEDDSVGNYLDPLYSTETTREDSIVREVGYINNQYEPSIQSSDIRLSVLNYTNLLGDLFEIYRSNYNQTVQANGGGNTNTDVNTDNLDNNNCKVVVNYLTNKGLNAAAAVGIAANIYHESTFRTAAVGDYGTSFGICQWHNDRGEAMKKMAGSDWDKDLTGQLDYLWYELNHSYKYVLQKIKAVKNTLEGCKKATDIFIRDFEVPSNVEMKTIQRQKTAEEYWNKIVIQNV